VQLRDFSVMNLLGQQVLVGKTTTQIDVSSLAKGTYMLKVGSEVAKFVKQ
jgi:Secretion system C-terminal sorting domain